MLCFLGDPHIHLWCETCWRPDSQHLLFQALLGLRSVRQCLTGDVLTIWATRYRQPFLFLDILPSCPPARNNSEKWWLLYWYDVFCAFSIKNAPHHTQENFFLYESTSLFPCDFITRLINSTDTFKFYSWKPPHSMELRLLANYKDPKLDLVTCF